MFENEVKYRLFRIALLELCHQNEVSFEEKVKCQNKLLSKTEPEFKSVECFDAIFEKKRRKISDKEDYNRNFTDY